MDDINAISGEHAGYVPCDEEASAQAASGQDANAVYGEDAGFVPDGMGAAADESEGTDSNAVFGRSAGYVAGPCGPDLCPAGCFDTFTRTETDSWGVSDHGNTWYTNQFNDVDTTDPTVSVNGSAGQLHILTSVPDPDNSAGNNLHTDPCHIAQYGEAWRATIIFSVDWPQQAPIWTDMILAFEATKGGDQSSYTLEIHDSNDPDIGGIQHRTLLWQIDKDEVTLDSSFDVGGLDDILDHEGGTHTFTWDYDPVGLSQTVWLDGLLLHTGPAYLQTNAPGPPPQGYTRFYVRSFISDDDTGVSEAVISIDSICFTFI